MSRRSDGPFNIMLGCFVMIPLTAWLGYEVWLDFRSPDLTWLGFVKSAFWKWVIYWCAPIWVLGKVADIADDIFHSAGKTS